jgi:hypothetical protein
VVFTAFLQLEFVAREVVIVGCGGRKVGSATRESKGSCKGSPKKLRVEQVYAATGTIEETKEDVTKGGYPVDGLPATVLQRHCSPLLQLDLGWLCSL